MTAGRKKVPIAIDTYKRGSPIRWKDVIMKYMTDRGMVEKESLNRNKGSV